MAQFSEPFGKAVAEVMDRHGYSTRDISKRSRGRVSAGTTLAMRDGKIVGPELIVAFAVAVGADPDELLRLAGWSWLRFDRKDWEETAGRVSRRGLRLSEALTVSAVGRG